VAIDLETDGIVAGFRPFHEEGTGLS
jgi:hypothetical protein